MTLTLYYHPFASFCMKVLVALYENDTPFAGRIVDLGDEADAAAFKRLSPMRKMPVLRDEARNLTIPETSIIIEYLELHYPGKTSLLPQDSGRALKTRQWDRFFDLYVQQPMQKIVGDRLRPKGQSDGHGVAAARAELATALGVVDADMAGKTWATGDDFTMADCAAAPALHYADRVLPIETYPHAAQYLTRLKQRPSFAHALEEAKPYEALFPQERNS